MYTHKSFPIPLYGSAKCKLHVIISDEKNWWKMIQTLDFFSDVVQEQPWQYHQVSAFATQTELKGIANFWVIFKDEPKSLSINTLAHECTHLTNFIFHSRGIQLSVKNDEPQAYLTGWITETVYNVIKKYLK